MTVTFQSDAACPVTMRDEPCLCAQDAPDFCTAPSAESLRAHASAHCPLCRGTGVATYSERNEPTLNVANDNAHRLLELLRLATPDGDLMGEVTLPEMRRALMRARNTFDQRAPSLTRAPSTLRGHRTRDDGTHALMTRATVGGLSEARLAEYLTALECLCAYAQAHGATVIQWA
jgi:hypothetical protein